VPSADELYVYVAMDTDYMITCIPAQVGVAWSKGEGQLRGRRIEVSI